ncbi:MAG TPA: NUDIX hydrolase [Gemmatimonadaceae bacterium]|nr:NUDIX hydrolase [Gemmatimonadaceae bacterium]
MGEGDRPRVGVGVLVLRNGRVLLGERKGSHGAATWAPPGGHLEYGETVETCAAREVLEETGLAVSDLVRGPWTNDVFDADRRHYLTVFLIARNASGEPRVCEPAKCARWDWFEWSALPAPLFAPMASLVAQGFRPS